MCDLPLAGANVGRKSRRRNCTTSEPGSPESGIHGHDSPRARYWDEREERKVPGHGKTALEGWGVRGTRGDVNWGVLTSMGSWYSHSRFPVQRVRHGSLEYRITGQA